VDKEAYIYGLADPETGTIRYVGKAVDPERRLKEHAYGSALHKQRWFNFLRKRGLGPELIILEQVQDGQDWRERELCWLKKIIDEGTRVVSGWGDINAATGTYCRHELLWQGSLPKFDAALFKAIQQEGRKPPIQNMVLEQMSFDLSSPDTIPASKHGYKINLQIARCIYRERQVAGISYKKLADKYGVSESMAYRICSGERWPEASLGKATG